MYTFHNNILDVFLLTYHSVHQKGQQRHESRKSLKGWKHHNFRTRASKSKTIIQKGLFSCYLAVKHVWFYLCLGWDPSEHTGSYLAGNYIQARLPWKETVSGKKQSFSGHDSSPKVAAKRGKWYNKKTSPLSCPSGLAGLILTRSPQPWLAVQSFALPVSPSLSF